MLSAVNLTLNTLWQPIGKHGDNITSGKSDFYVEQDPPPQKGQWAGFAGIQNMGSGRSVSASVYKADNFSTGNPVFIVSGKDVDGTNFKVAVNINNVNPNNASLIEMYALNAYRSVNGLPRIPKIVWDTSNPKAGLDAARVSNASGQADFLTPLLELMEMQRTHKNWESFFLLKDMTSWLTQFSRA